MDNWMLMDILWKTNATLGKMLYFAGGRGQPYEWGSRMQFAALSLQRGGQRFSVMAVEKKYKIFYCVF